MTTAATQTTPPRPAQPQITENYRAIGPAAVLAALICMPKARAKHVQPAVPQAA